MIHKSRFKFVATLSVRKLSRAHLYLAVGVVLIGVLPFAFAATSGDVTTALTPVSTFFCSIARFARNNIAYAILAAALIIGALMKGGGMPLGVRVMQGSLFGGLVVLVAPPVIALFVAAGTCALAGGA
jgi:hypothetical protein